jgi:hypothetical protein
MPLSLYDEIQALLKRGVEQSPVAHRAMTEGQEWASVEESIDLLVRMVVTQGQAVLRIASKVDELQASIEGG